MDEVKTLKDYAKEAKTRLKRGFWQEYAKELEEKLEVAEAVGVSASKVKEYCARRVSEDIKSADEGREDFYRKVKALLDEEGEVSDAIGRLTDKELLKNMPYDEGQRYVMSVAERYLKAVERYKKEKFLSLGV